MNKKTRVTLLTFSYIFILSACGPKDYDDCVLQHSKGVNDEYVMKSIQSSCSDKFLYQNVNEKKKSCTSRKLADDELSKIQWLNTEFTNHADIHIGGPRIWFKIYNGNSKISIDVATIKVTSPNFPSEQTYKVFFATEPQSKGSSNVEIAATPSEGWNYSISEVSGSICK
jgi:hypothetical protein